MRYTKNQAISEDLFQPKATHFERQMGSLDLMQHYVKQALAEEAAKQPLPDLRGLRHLPPSHHAELKREAAVSLSLQHTHLNIQYVATGL